MDVDEEELPHPTYIFFGLPEHIHETKEAKEKEGMVGGVE